MAIRLFREKELGEKKAWQKNKQVVYAGAESTVRSRILLYTITPNIQHR